MEKNNITKKDNVTKKDLVDFGEIIGKSFEQLKKEMNGKIEKIEKEKIVSSHQQDFPAFLNLDEYVLKQNIEYLGNKDQAKEEMMKNELKMLMKKHRILKCRAELFKVF